MEKKSLIVVIVVVIILISAVLFIFLTTKEGDNSSSTVITNQNIETKQNTVPDKNTTSGMYIDYSETALNNTEGTKILFFHAPWCPQCREIETSINEDGIPSGVTVFKVDYDSHQSLRNKYGVTLQTTFVEVDDKGNKIDSYVAYEEPRFSSVVRELLRD